MSTSHALDRLERPEVSSRAVAAALVGYRRIAALPRSTLRAAHSDYTEFMAPGDRTVLDHALSALPRRAAAPLRAAVHRIDTEYESKTLPNPATPPGPWWTRRHTT